MPPSWSIPVAQALQRHSGGWASPPIGEQADCDDLASDPAMEASRSVANRRANVEDSCPAGATGAHAASR